MTNDKYLSNPEVVILYSGDVAYIGKVEQEDMNTADSGKPMLIVEPFVLNIRPIHNQQAQQAGQQRIEAVVLDLILPVEFAGVGLNENLYSGFVNFTATNPEMPSGKSQNAAMENGQVVCVNRISSLANEKAPSILLIKIDKIIIPSDDLVAVYESRAKTYSTLMYGTRMVDFQAMQEQTSAENLKSENIEANTPGNVIELPTVN